MSAFTFKPAVRDRVGLLIGIAGASGSGKSLSALRVARGLAGGDDSRIAAIDTEGGRLKHYAPATGEPLGPYRFGFAHGDLAAPFTPEAYVAAIDEADKAGFEVIVIDSFSHSWDGYGGLQDMHGELVEHAVKKARDVAAEKNWRFDESQARDKASIGAWKEPKTRLKRMVSRLLQCRAHLVICMRAEEKMRMETVEEEGRNGKSYKKTVIIPAKDLPPAERWVPIVERKFPYELTLSIVLTPAAPGVPIPIKLQEQHRSAVPLDQPLSEETGQRLAAWARGETSTATPTSSSRASRQDAGPATPPPSRPASTDWREQLQGYADALARETSREGLEEAHKRERPIRFKDAPDTVTHPARDILYLHTDRIDGQFTLDEANERVAALIERL